MTRAHYRKPRPAPKGPPIVDDPTKPIGDVLFGPLNRTTDTPPAEPERVQTQEESSMADTKTTLAPIGSTAVDLTKLPAFLDGAFTPDEWGAMSDEDKVSALVMWREEQQATTEGLEVQFPRVKYPTSGASFWEKPTTTGDPEPLKELDAVVIFKQPVRAYWPLGDEVGNNPPTCSSKDGVKPEEGPGKQAAACASCPQSKWGSGKESRGQACKARLNVFVLFPSDEIPTVVSLPPTSLKTFASYAVALRQQKSALLAVTTVFGLQDAKSAGGQSFKALVLKIGRKLTFVEMKQARALREVFEQQMAKRGVKVDEVEAEDHPAGSEGQVLDADGKPIPF